MSQVKCKHCGETENLHFNYAQHISEKPLESVLCNECGELTEIDEI